MASTFPGSLDNFSTSLAAGAVHTSARQNDNHDAINKIEARVIKEGPLNVQWPEYGAVGDGVTNDRPAIHLARDALPSSGTEGGRILFPPGNYLCTSGLDFSGREGVTLEGVGGRRALAAGTEGRPRLVFSATGSTPHINLQTTNAIDIRDLSIFSTSGSFTGHVIDCAGASGDNTSHLTFDGVYLDGGAASRSPASLVNLTCSHTVAFRDCTLFNAQLGVNGYTAPYSSANAFANSVSFDRCMFQNNVTAHVWNPDGNWAFRCCTIEPLASNLAGFIKHDSAEQAKGLVIDACWFGDAVGGGTNSWLKFSGWGLVMLGNNMNGESGTLSFVELDANTCKGIFIAGNRFNGNGATTSNVLNFGATTGHSSVWLGPNRYDTITNVTTGTIPDTLLGVSSTGAFQFGDDAIMTRVAANQIGLGSGDSLSFGTGTGTGSFCQFFEQTSDPAAPAANGARLFAKDNGSGKSQLVVRFNSGATQVIATEP